MTSPASAANPSPAQSISSAAVSRVEIHVLHCGQGDTILLKLPEGKWALVDCNLYQKNVRDAFFQQVAALGITRLDLVCLTHPHEDHYTGLESVIEYFTTGGREIGIFCDCGVDPKEIHTLLARRNRPASAVREYERIYKLIYKLIEAKRIKYVRADENTIAILRVGAATLIPVGPRAAVAKIAVKNTVASGRIKADLNRLSVVLTLSVSSGTSNFLGLLAADTDADGFHAAIASLGEKLAISKPMFDFIKVSHHGSLDSHETSKVCEFRQTGVEAVAAVSCGTFDVLPDRNVLKDFLDKNWLVLLTTKRIAAQRQYALQLSGQTTTAPQVQIYDLKTEWDSATGLVWGPGAAKLDSSELDHYSTAKR